MPPFAERAVAPPGSRANSLPAAPPDPAWVPLGRALAVLHTARPPVPWPLLRRVTRALRQSPAGPRPGDVPAARAAVETALAAIGTAPASGSLTLMIWAVLDPLRLYTVTVPRPQTFTPPPAIGPTPLPLSPAQVQARHTLRAVWGARLRVMGGTPLSPLWLGELLADLRAGYGMLPWCSTGWQGLDPAVIADALWGVTPEALEPDAAAAWRTVLDSAPPPSPDSRALVDAGPVPPVTKGA